VLRYKFRFTVVKTLLITSLATASCGNSNSSDQSQSKTPGTSEVHEKPSQRKIKVDSDAAKPQSNPAAEPKIAPIPGDPFLPPPYAGGDLFKISVEPLYQCNAWPANATTMFYWIHANVNIAAKTVMSVCWNRTYLPCNYRCFRIQ
jgi:hypothetical protein